MCDLQTLSRPVATQPANMYKSRCLEMLNLKVTSADHHDTLCGGMLRKPAALCSQALGFSERRYSYRRFVSWRRENLAIGRPSWCSMDLMSIAEEKLRWPGTPGPQQSLNHARNHAKRAASQDYRSLSYPLVRKGDLSGSDRPTNVALRRISWGLGVGRSKATSVEEYREGFECCLPGARFMDLDCIKRCHAVCKIPHPDIRTRFAEHQFTSSLRPRFPLANH